MSAFIASRMFNSALMIEPGKAQAILLALGGRVAEQDLEFVAPIDITDHSTQSKMGIIGDRVGKSYDREGKLPFAMDGGLAIIPIEGSLVNKGGYVGKSSGVTSYEGLLAQVIRAGNANQVKGVVFEIDSFGGEVAGAFQLADKIHQVANIKPTLAILTDHAASAGYLLASAARNIVAPKTGLAGSIGVIQVHADLSKRLEQNGIKVTVLRSGKYKADANPYEGLADETAAKITKQLDAMRQMFAQHVSTYRQAITYKQAMDTEAELYSAGDAQRLGLIDAIASPLDAFEMFSKRVNR